MLLHRVETRTTSYCTAWLHQCIQAQHLDVMQGATPWLGPLHLQDACLFQLRCRMLNPFHTPLSRTPPRYDAQPLMLRA